MDPQHFAQSIETLLRSVVSNQQDGEQNDTMNIFGDIPPLEPVTLSTATTSTVVTGDVTMENTSEAPPFSSNLVADDHDDDMLPELRSISNSSDEDSNSSSSDRDADEVEMQTVEDDNDSSWTDDNDGMPSLEPTNTPAGAAPRGGNRRARVDDDDDEERDRRHPSQRVGNNGINNQTTTLPSSPAPGSPPLPTTQPPPRLLGPLPHIRAIINVPGFRGMGGGGGDPFSRFFQNRGNAANNAGNNNNNGNNTNTGPNPQQMFGGFAITLDLNGTPVLHNHTMQGGAPQPHTHGPGTPLGGDFAAFRDFLGMFGAHLGMFGEREQEDPERAKRLVDGLEEVPVGLVRRLERVGGSGNGNGEEEVGGSGGDSGCAICWDRLLDGEGDGFGSKEEKGAEGREEEDEVAPVSPEQTSGESSSSAPSHSDFSESREPTHPKIVSLPCAHVFHASCLIPWFTRPGQTTCPTCRFNIDPENLTYIRRRPQPNPAVNPTQTGTPTNTTTSAPNAAPTTLDQQPINVQPTGPLTGETANPPQNEETVSTDVPVIHVEGSDSDGVASGSTITESTPAGAHQPQPDSSLPTADPTAPPLVQPIPVPPAAPPAPAPAPTNTQNAPAQGFLTFGFDVFIGAPPGMNLGAMGMDMEEGEDDFAMGEEMQQAWNDNFPDFPMPNAPGGTDTHGPAPTSTDPTTRPAPPPAPPAATNPPATEGSDAIPPPPGARTNLPFPRFAHHMFPGMNAGPGVHVAAGTGRTMNEAFAALFGGRGPIFGENTSQAGAPDPPQAEASSQANADEAPLEPAPQAGAAPLTEDAGETQGPAPAENARPPNAQNGPGAPLPDFFSTLLNTMPPGGFGRAVPFSMGGQQTPADPTTNPNLRTMPHPLADQLGNPFTIPNILSGFPTQAGRDAGMATDGAPPPLPQGTPNPFAPFPGPFQVPGGSGAPAPPRPTRDRKQWTVPPAPGSTLRQRIERKEREAGLRCYDVSCGIGPSDDDPFTSLPVEAMKQLSIRPHKGEAPVAADASVCTHTFHSSCLVSSERVALRGGDATIVGDDVEVSCSVCRGTGCVSKADWDEGVQALT